mmetsp:Transcript_1701/g.7427  ORF Transcript_1701/g.7427 Transcript_1701/m.7427 type:complete len:230 (-) Transcript_1701:627-1316(-)
MLPLPEGRHHTRAPSRSPRRSTRPRSALAWSSRPAPSGSRASTPPPGGKGPWRMPRLAPHRHPWGAPRRRRPPDSQPCRPRKAPAPLRAPWRLPSGPPRSCQTWRAPAGRASPQRRRWAWWFPRCRARPPSPWGWLHDHFHSRRLRPSSRASPAAPRAPPVLPAAAQERGRPDRSSCSSSSWRSGRGSGSIPRASSLGSSCRPTRRRHGAAPGPHRLMDTPQSPRAGGR